MSPLRGLTLLLPLLAPQDPASDLRVPASWRTVSVQLTVRPRTLQLRTPSGRVNLPLDVVHEGHGATAARVLGAWRGPEGLAVLLATAALSRGLGAEMGYCGAGEERALVWMLIRGGAVRRREVVSTASCLHTREGDVSADADSLWGTVEDYPDSTRRAFVFRRARAADGLHLRDVARLPR